MSAPPSELSLDYKPTDFPVASKPFGDQPEHTHRLEEFLTRLEEERLKIEAFKRELPLCMQLLTNAMETYKQQLETYQSSQGGAKPVLEEFMPIKSMSIDGVDKGPKASSEKSSWMVSAQLWGPSAIDMNKQQQQQQAQKEAERAFDMSPKLAFDGKQRNGGAFMPFSKDKIKAANSAAQQALPDLALASPSSKEMESKNLGELDNGGGGSRRDANGSKGPAAAEQGKGAHADGQNGAQQTHRKPRRCWSPDLHRRFVNALQILGGSQVATPKQIRELMKVDGLTNDEVKSHLQKYRLHTRRPMAAPQPAAAAAPQLVVLGGIWVPPEYATSAAAAAAAAPAIYGAQPGPVHYCTPPVAQDFYPAAAAAAVAQHHLQPALHRGVAGAFKGRMGPPEQEIRGGAGERSESIEEEEEGEDREEEEEEDEEDEEMEADENPVAEKALVPVGPAAAEGGGLMF